jgi:hypothetical protein
MKISNGITKITIRDNVFPKGALLDLHEIYVNLDECSVSEIIIEGQLFRRDLILTAARLKRLIKGKTGVIRLVVCNCCGKLFVEGNLEHTDFDFVEDVMEE